MPCGLTTLCSLCTGMQVDNKAQAKPAEGTEAKDSTKEGAKETSLEGTQEGQKEAAAPKEPEPSSHSLDNPARVVPAQEKLVKFPEGSRYTPIRPGRTAGILLLKDSSPGNWSCASQLPTDLAVHGAVMHDHAVAAPRLSLCST